MPNGRLARAVLNGQCACELYVNDSGSAASVTLFSNSISTNTNARITTVVGVAATAFNLSSTVFDVGANGVGIGTTITCNLCCFAGWNYCNPYQCDASKQLTQGMTTGFYRAQLCAPGIGFTYNNVDPGHGNGSCDQPIGFGKSTRTPWAYMEYVSIAGSMTSFLCRKLCSDNTTLKENSEGYPYASCTMTGTCIGSCINSGNADICKCECWVKAPYGGTTQHSLTLGFCRTCLYDGCDTNGVPNYNSLTCNYCCRGCSDWSHIVGLIPGWCNYTNPWSGHCCGRGRMKDFYVITACNIDTSNYDLGARFTVNPLPCTEVYQTYLGGTCPRGFCACDAAVGYVPYGPGVCCCAYGAGGGNGYGPKRCLQQFILRGGSQNCSCRWWCTCMFDVGAFANWWALDPSQYANFCEHHCIDEDGNFYTWRRCGTATSSAWQQCCGNLCQKEEWDNGYCLKCDGHTNVVGSAGVFAMHWNSMCVHNRSMDFCICCSEYTNCGRALAFGCSYDQSAYITTNQQDGFNPWFCWPQCCCAIGCNCCINQWGPKIYDSSIPMSPYGVACAVSCGLFVMQYFNRCCGTMYNIGFPHVHAFRCCAGTSNCPTVITMMVGVGYCDSSGNRNIDGNNYNSKYHRPDWNTALHESCVGAEFTLKYFAYNPRKCCHYGLFRTGIATAVDCPTACSCAALNGVNPSCGVFSFNARRINKTAGVCKAGTFTTFACGCISERCIRLGLAYDASVCVWANDSAAGRSGIVTTFWCKVANFPSDWLCEYYVTPRMCVSCLYRYSFSEWTISLYNCNTCAWDPWTSKDLITWDKSPFNQTVCEDPLHTCCLCLAQAKVISNQDTFMKCMDCSGLIDLCTEMNQYERTGIVLSDGDRLSIKNHSADQPINVQVWGYEG